MNDYLKNIHGGKPNSGGGGGNRRNSRTPNISVSSPSIDYELMKNAFSHAIENTSAKLPANLFTPQDAKTFDLRKMVIVPPATINAELFSFEIPIGFNVSWNYYALFNDALLTANSEFHFTIDGIRVLDYHGDPSDNFKLSLGANAFLDDNSLFEANIAVQPKSVIRIGVSNTDVVDVIMGARIKGVIDNSNPVTSKRFG